MKITFYEVILFITLFQLITFSTFLLTKKPYKLSNILLGLFLSAQVMGVFHVLTFSQFDFFSKNAPHFYLIGMPFALLWGPLFYFYVHSIEDHNFKLKSVHLLHLLPFFLEAAFFAATYYFLEPESKISILLNLPGWFKYASVFLNVFILVQILIYNIFSLRLLYKFRNKLKENFSSISKINFNWLSIVIIGYTLAHFVSMTVGVMRFYDMGVDNLTRILLMSTFLLFFNIIFFKGWRQPEIFSGIEETIKYKSSKLTKEEAESWIAKINNIMYSKKPYLSPGITINQLAEDVDIPPRVFSQIINEYFNQNFYDYINNFRIEESKKMLLDSSNKMNILEILYEVGFNSKPSFNAAFKKATGLTPTQFKKENTFTTI